MAAVDGLEREYQELGDAWGAAYSQFLLASGGTGPYTWSVTGTLPPGLTLDANSGVISGTPTTPGTYPF